MLDNALASQVAELSRRFYRARSTARPAWTYDEHPRIKRIERYLTRRACVRTRVYVYVLRARGFNRRPNRFRTTILISRASQADFPLGLSIIFESLQERDGGRGRGESERRRRRARLTTRTNGCTARIFSFVRKSTNDCIFIVDFPLVFAGRIPRFIVPR